ncbi:MAG TPA: nucleotide exchange factor GrpE [Candidatus Anaerobutyricum stercoris]|uniref:Protein GrpE n=1 Tax=Candidatus Anaerobutyricum stercoris TaxID=2838457 RepID=A0A9D2J7X9_9FIRM|nr:nucleotide exchange factor GrpE [Eubacterium sp. An3]OUO28517.1 nucleotide exchange factor GrpE [Eubacterium sp. An3]CVI73138.1 heat shock protein GrpE [Eubacteriaceae bacterium CHKCI004]HIZ39803.1 nucleotide exchange factor GrpE [Candidatus Anaerobutyricum stercoris]
MEENKKEFDESIVDENISEAAQDEEQKEDASEEANAAETAEAAGDAAEGEEESDEPDSKKKKKKSARALEIELKKSQEMLADITDKYQRLMAEFENARKRNAKEQSRMYDIGAKEVLAKLLPVVDNFERGLDALSEEEKEGAFAQGIEKIYQQLMTVFDEIGVKAMDAAGKEFNPDFHNAVMHVEDEELGENLVVEEFQKGYMYKDSVLRHSMVKVAN